VLTCTIQIKLPTVMLQSVNGVDSGRFNYLLILTNLYSSNCIPIVYIQTNHTISTAFVFSSCQFWGVFRCHHVQNTLTQIGKSFVLQTLPQRLQSHLHEYSPSEKASSCFIQDKGGSNSIYTKNQTIIAIHTPTRTDRTSKTEDSHQSFACE
jgi:hypothetical protein